MDPINVLPGGIGALVEQAGRIAEQFALGDADRKRLQLQLGALVEQHDSNVQQGADAAIDTRQKLIVSEMQQGDGYTRRARPSVVYAGLLFIFLNYVVIPGVGYLTGAASVQCDNAVKTATCEVKGGLPLPREFWWAWGGIVGTWSIGRSYEKARGANRVSSLITGSTPAAAGPASGAVG